MPPVSDTGSLLSRVKHESQLEKSKVGWEWKQCLWCLHTRTLPTPGSKWGWRHVWPCQKCTVTWVISIVDLPHHFVELYMCVYVPLSDLDVPLSAVLIEADTWEGLVYDSPQPVHIKVWYEHQLHLLTSSLDACSLHRPSTDNLLKTHKVSKLKQRFDSNKNTCVWLPLLVKPSFNVL